MKLAPVGFEDAALLLCGGDRQGHVAHSPPSGLNHVGNPAWEARLHRSLGRKGKDQGAVDPCCVGKDSNPELLAQSDKLLRPKREYEREHVHDEMIVEHRVPGELPERASGRELA